MKLMRDSSDLQVKKAVNILLGTVIKGKMNVSYLHTSSETETLKMIYKPKKLFLFKWCVLLHCAVKYKVRLKVSLQNENEFHCLENFIGKTTLIWVWREEAWDKYFRHF